MTITSKLLRCLLSLLSLSFCLHQISVPATVLAQDKSKSTLEAIRKGWKDRQERVRSARFNWSEARTQTRGSISKFWKIRNPELTEVIPPKDTTLSRVSSVSFDGNRLRYEYTSAKWARKTKAYEPYSYLAAFDGAVCKMLDRYSENHDNPYPQGMVRTEKQHFNAREAALDPILMTFRSMTPGMRSHDLDTFQLTGRKAVIDKRSCLELRKRLDFANLEIQLWVDPARDFVVVRVLRLQKSLIQTRIDVSYDGRADGIWVPSAWRIIFNDREGSLLESSQARLKDYEINPTIAVSEFDIEFPPGTAVYNAKEQTQYILKPDGSGKRVIPPSDIGATYEQILKTEPGRARGQTFEGYYNWWAIIGTLLGVACIVLLCYKFVQRKRGDTSNETVKS